MPFLRGSTPSMAIGLFCTLLKTIISSTLPRHTSSLSRESSENAEGSWCLKCFRDIRIRWQFFFSPELIIVCSSGKGIRGWKSEPLWPLTHSSVSPAPSPPVRTLIACEPGAKGFLAGPAPHPTEEATILFPRISVQVMKICESERGLPFSFLWALDTEAISTQRTGILQIPKAAVLVCQPEALPDRANNWFDLPFFFF